MTQAARITILGAGFGALATVRELRRRDAGAQITVVSPRPELHYLPSIIWIPSGLRRREDLIVPLGPFFERMGVRHVAAEVTGLTDDGRSVHTTAGDIDNDALVIATGGRFLKKLPGIENAITPCEGIAAAELIRDRLAAMQGGTIAIGFAANPQEPQAVRGGPMFEFLFGIDTQLRREGRRERFQLVFFNPSQEPGARLGAKTVQGLLAEMARRGIATHLGHKMLRFEPGKVVTEGGEIAADLILFMPGMTGNAWFDATTLPRSPGGLLRADAQCRIEGWQHCYVVGDSGSFPGPEWAPKQAHMAELHAKAAAANLLDALAGRPEQAGFVPQLACIIDSGSHGTLVLRSPQRTLVLPPLRLMHWAKRRFEARYLGQYR
ncbi:MAG: NAD(P)/FAD-dependent oxidoreductase [Alicycliphilus sp.]|jgi:sulfide:quinone oxidoreductase|uniref:FAD/NAD(P)-binding oxidoreductase n=1 Tax=Diaphorobacter limosus TaxID=3036128 RepID=A0ABZ0J4V0_9BURK|nr:FAD/NAD(P)-binding oxidoreductase [Diaphorobacter sp. Y-1]MBP6752952.1 NAD(P)/FAD-dependent oxidoreductase [Alicycliphilus sp.]MBP7326496.1 NAD(P)/FAD-dependent oxidoreductase [Alicycliphilus sp.]WOO33270.1 FAD/NAD(P)-binding oxidoreductase [Diaphorobacter sp. Y-1]HRM49986.1 FAD/NAD(P)-binding oxidoreductase [Alicycliphilus sp.]